MIRRTFLRLAATCLIHPAFNWMTGSTLVDQLPRYLHWKNYVEVYEPEKAQLVAAFQRAAVVTGFLPLHPEHHQRERPAG